MAASSSAQDASTGAWGSADGSTAYTDSVAHPMMFPFRCVVCSGAARGLSRISIVMASACGTACTASDTSGRHEKACGGGARRKAPDAPGSVKDPQASEGVLMGLAVEISERRPPASRR